MLNAKTWKPKMLGIRKRYHTYVLSLTEESNFEIDKTFRAS